MIRRIMRKSTGRGLVGAVVAFVGCALVACSAGDGPPRSQLVLAFQSDLKLPDDISQVLLSVESRGNLLFAEAYPVGPSGVKLPATLTLHDPEDAVKPVTIRLVGLSPRNEARTLKETQTTIPSRRSALLRVPVEFLCLDDKSVANPDELAAVATEPARVVTRLARSSCGDGRTCNAGDCVDSVVDSATLPDFDEKIVFGGGTTGGGGVCFDVQGCFASAVTVPPDDACTIPAPQGDLGRVNVGILPKARREGERPDGVCDEAGRCVVVLSGESAGGWRSEAGRLRLPKAVCEKGLEVVVTAACARKDETVSPCGAWSSVTGSGGAIDGDAGAVIVGGETRPDGSVATDAFAIGDGRPARQLRLDGANVVWLVGDEIATCGVEGCGARAQLQAALPSVRGLVATGGALGLFGGADGRSMRLRPEGSPQFAILTAGFGNGITSLAVSGPSAAWSNGTNVEYCERVVGCTQEVHSAPPGASGMVLVQAPRGLVFTTPTELRYCDPGLGSDFPCPGAFTLRTTAGVPSDLRQDAANLYWLEKTGQGTELRDYPIGNLPDGNQGQAWITLPDIAFYAPAVDLTGGQGAPRVALVAGSELLVLGPPSGPNNPSIVARIPLGLPAGRAVTGFAATAGALFVGLSNGDVVKYPLAATGGGGGVADGGGGADAGVPVPADAGAQF